MNNKYELELFQVRRYNNHLEIGQSLIGEVNHGWQDVVRQGMGRPRGPSAG